MTHQKTFLLLFTLALCACTTTTKKVVKNDEVKKEDQKKKTVKKVVRKSPSKAVKKKKVVLKTAPKKYPSSARDVYSSVRDAEAIPYVNGNIYCKALAERNVCPAGSKETWSVGLRGKKVSDCMARCETKANRLTGPYERVVIYGRSNISFDRGAYVKNQPDGKWVRGQFICDGKKADEKCKEAVLSESHYKAGFGLDGEQKDWTQKGVLIRKQMYKNGAPVGELIEWWDNGKKRTKGKYKNGRLSGKYNQWHQDGKVSLKSGYKNGQLDGEYQRFDYKGTVLSSGKYLGGVKVGKWESFYKKNVRQSVEHYDKKGKPNGKFCNWVQSGELLGCFEMKNGNGTFKEYTYGSKKVSHSYTMKNGQKDGKELHYGYDGALVSEVHWKAGLQHGMYTQWDGEGRVVSEFEYRYSEMHGKYYQRYFSGEKANITQGQYCRNRQCGVWEYAMQDGRYREERYNSNGVLISEKSFSATGELESEWPSRNGNGTYQSCLEKMLAGGCCQAGKNLPSGARVCPPKYP